MGDAAIAEKRALPRESLVDELIDEHKKPRIKMRLERAARGNRNDVGTARALPLVDIGSIMNARGHGYVAAAGAGQEHGFGRPNAAEAKRVRGLAPRCRPPFLADDFEARQFIDARSPDDAHDRFCHANSASVNAAVSTSCGRVARENDRSRTAHPCGPSRPHDEFTARKFDRWQGE